MSMSFETRIADLRHGRVAYWEAGEGDPCVVVHGNFGSKRWFLEQLGAPPAGWRLIAPDLPNCAESDALADHSLSRYASVLLELCDLLEAERFALLGHSLGGAVAQALAVAAPERVRALLLLDSAGPRGHETDPEHLALLESLYGKPEALGAALAATAPSRRPDWFPAIVADALRMRRESYSGHARALSEFNLGDRPRGYRGPVLVIRGELEPPHLISEATARETAAAYPCGTFESWPGVGHSPQLEAPDRFNRRLAQFLEEAP